MDTNAACFMEGMRRMKRILVNRIQCKCCGGIIMSEHRYDLVRCPCGSVAVDGGTDYLKRLTYAPAAEYVELSEFEDGGPTR